MSAEKDFSSISELWSLSAPMVFHRRVENFIYFSAIGEKEVVVRLTEPEKRSFKQLEAELHWQFFLMSRGANAASPLASKNGNLVESVEINGTKFYSCVFERAFGQSLREKDHLTPQNMELWGATLAQFHEATTDYERPAHITARPSWEQSIEPEIEKYIYETLGSREQLRYDEIKEELKLRPQDRQSYGLVHTDMHMGNFLWQGDQIVAFDFDDCCHHWFAYDFAVPLFYLRFLDASEELNLDLKSLEDSYLKGYKKIRPVEDFWTVEAEKFVTLRSLIMYGWCRMQIAQAKLSEENIQWCHEFLKWIGSRRL